MSRKEIVGSWFPTGYHGNYLCKTRPDPCSEYRLLAKPTPPNRFLFRMTEKSMAHPFSKHDNKHMFPTDAMYLGKGVGRRKIERKSVSENPISWHCRRESERKNDVNANEDNQIPPTISGYRYDYHTPHDPYHQKLVKRPATSFDVGRPQTTTYRYAHGSMNPNRQRLVDIAAETTMHKKRGRSAVQLRALSSESVSPPTSHAVDSVARCMTWSTGADPGQRRPRRSMVCLSPPYERDDMPPPDFQQKPLPVKPSQAIHESICTI